MLKQLHTLQLHSNASCEVHPMGPCDKSKWEICLSLAFLRLGTPGGRPPRQISSLSSLQDMHQAWLRFRCSVVRRENTTLKVHPVQEKPAPQLKGTLWSQGRTLMEALGPRTLLRQRPLQLTCAFLLLQCESGACQESVVLFLRLLTSNFLVDVIM